MVQDSQLTQTLSLVIIKIIIIIKKKLDETNIMSETRSILFKALKQQHFSSGGSKGREQFTRRLTEMEMALFHASRLLLNQCTKEICCGWAANRFFLVKFPKSKKCE